MIKFEDFKNNPLFSFEFDIDNSFTDLAKKKRETNNQDYFHLDIDDDCPRDQWFTYQHPELDNIILKRAGLIMEQKKQNQQQSIRKQDKLKEQQEQKKQLQQKKGGQHQSISQKQQEQQQKKNPKNNQFWNYDYHYKKLREERSRSQSQDNNNGNNNSQLSSNSISINNQQQIKPKWNNFYNNPKKRNFDEFQKTEDQIIEKSTFQHKKVNPILGSIMLRSGKELNNNHQNVHNKDQTDNKNTNIPIHEVRQPIIQRVKQDYHKKNLDLIANMQKNRKMQEEKENNNSKNNTKFDQKINPKTTSLIQQNLRTGELIRDNQNINNRMQNINVNGTKQNIQKRGINNNAMSKSSDTIKIQRKNQYPKKEEGVDGKQRRNNHQLPSKDGQQLYMGRSMRIIKQTNTKSRSCDQFA